MSRRVNVMPVPKRMMPTISPAMVSLVHVYRLLPLSDLYHVMLEVLVAAFYNVKMLLFFHSDRFHIL